jgi:hypothetical protein
MNRDRERRDQLRIALEAAPLDRVRLMKTAFLVWDQRGRPDDGPFSFEPYLYGPCAFDLYSTIDQLKARGEIVQAPASRWALYRLTPKGYRIATAAAGRLSPDVVAALRRTAQWAAKQGFRPLLDYVYAKAPDFARRSVLRRSVAP